MLLACSASRGQRSFVTDAVHQNFALQILTRWRVGLVLWDDQVRWLHPGEKPETTSFSESALGIAVFRNQSGNFAAGRYNRFKRFSYAKANVSLNEHVEPTGLFRPVVISRVILKHRVHSAIHSLAMTFCPSRF
jgi:hypothetical protein